MREIDGRTVSWFSLDGGKHRGAIGTAEGETIARAVHLAVELGMPIVGRIASSGADVSEGLSALHAWGRVAKALTDASGVVPIVLVLVGPAVSGPALLLGIADHVIMTADAFAYVTGPEVVAAFTGVPITSDRLGGATVHERESGVATLVVADEDEALVALETLLSYLPSNHLQDPPFEDTDDPVDRPCARAAGAVPARATASYDVRTVIDDVCDEHTFLELRARLRAEHGHRTQPTRRAPRRHRRQPADVPRRHARHRGVAQGGPLRAVVRRVQLPDRHVRRHARLRARAATSSGAA